MSKRVLLELTISNADAKIGVLLDNGQVQDLRGNAILQRNSEECLALFVDDRLGQKLGGTVALKIDQNSGFGGIDEKTQFMHHGEYPAHVLKRIVQISR